MPLVGANQLASLRHGGSESYGAELHLLVLGGLVPIPGQLPGLSVGREACAFTKNGSRCGATPGQHIDQYHYCLSRVV
jgi:hypothetical protein